MKIQYNDGTQIGSSHTLYLEPDNDGRGEIELACRGNDALSYDVTAHDSAKDVHQDGVHLDTTKS
jgi:hypothetical protein